MDKKQFIEKYLKQLKIINDSLKEILNICEKDINDNINTKEINETLPINDSIDEIQYKLNDYIDYIETLQK